MRSATPVQKTCSPASASGMTKTQVGVRAQVEFAHAQPAEGDHHHLVARRVARRRGRRRLRDGDAVGRFDHAVRQRRRFRQRGENGRPLAECSGSGCAASGGGRSGAATAASASALAVELYRLPDLLEQLRIAQQMVGEIRAVLEKIQHARRQRRRPRSGARAYPGRRTRSRGSARSARGRGAARRPPRPPPAAARAGPGSRSRLLDDAGGSASGSRLGASGGTL